MEKPKEDAALSNSNPRCEDLDDKGERRAPFWFWGTAKIEGGGFGGVGFVFGFVCEEERERAKEELQSEEEEFGILIWESNPRVQTSQNDKEDNAFPQWEQTLIARLNAPPSYSTVYIDIVHDGAKDDVKPLIGSACQWASPSCQ
ncbi:hypothetical protein Droror1_Dr00023497 [Drosera rotundifolia]